MIGCRGVTVALLNDCGQGFYLGLTPVTDYGSSCAILRENFSSMIDAMICHQSVH